MLLALRRVLALDDQLCVVLGLCQTWSGKVSSKEGPGLHFVSFTFGITQCEARVHYSDHSLDAFGSYHTRSRCGHELTMYRSKRPTTKVVVCGLALCATGDGPLPAGTGAA
ncbi:hypothetical protein B0H34DRAFT_91375 [Crassisporium funariophilum]|nr:hypothetical protein B0H34DRAFT_91375 [Crassisporium funariophilum]